MSFQEESPSKEEEKTTPLQNEELSEQEKGNPNASFHYMYVLLCADSTLYTGYTNDLHARITAHNEGKGAKYTRARRPVELLISAEFSDKTEAMSAEYHFKKLPRQKKNKLISLGNTTPFQDVLRTNLNLRHSKNDENCEIAAIITTSETINKSEDK